MADNIAYVAFNPGILAPGFAPGSPAGATIPVSVCVLTPQNTVLESPLFPNPSYFNVEVNYGSTQNTIHAAVLTFMKELTGDETLTVVFV